MKLYYFVFLFLFSNAALSDAPDEVTNKTLNEYFDSDLDYEAFFRKLKSGILAGDKHLVASLNSYPVRVNYPTGTEYYDTKDQFIENYDSIVLPEMLKRVNEQQFESLFYNYNGLHIGYGDIWFSPICVDGEQCKKIEINVWAYSVLSVSKE